jgi:homoserine kinase type II
MAVYTKVSTAQAEAFLEQYDLGTFERLDAILQGVENTNYHLFTSRGRYILTLFEKRIDPQSLPFVFGYMDHIYAQGMICPHAIENRAGQTINELCDRPAAIISFLEGHNLERNAVEPAHCEMVGTAMARMHVAAKDFTMTRPNPVGRAKWKELIEATSDRAAEIQPGLKERIESEYDFQCAQWKMAEEEGMPRGAIHADIFPDNVFINDSGEAGFIDFYFACTGFYAYDLAITISAWCFDNQNRFDSNRFQKLYSHYNAGRKLNDAERNMLPVFCRAACLRFTLTRLYDVLFHPADSFVTPHDPAEYIERLRFFKETKIEC